MCKAEMPLAGSKCGDGMLDGIEDKGREQCPGTRALLAARGMYVLRVSALTNPDKSTGGGLDLCR
ncbi:hypothetical protein TWF718_000357 [Orbilia javanica]|uniref:Uncharacterized protein n=1 Tax=Orbilia javanica TaxID=47235 RepID=A0AAN8N7C2_9PEZI